MLFPKKSSKNNTPREKPKVRTIKSFKPQSFQKSQNRIDTMDLDELDNFIEATRKYKHNYSRSTLLTYVPLTKNQKISMIEEEDLASEKNLKKYSDLFTEIKNQITDININLRQSFHEKQKNIKPKASSRAAYYYEDNDQINEEIDEEIISPDTRQSIRFSQKMMTSFDEKELGEVDEGKDTIIVNNTQRCNGNNDKLFEKTKLNKELPKIIKDKPKRSKGNIHSLDDERPSEDLMTNANSNNPIIGRTTTLNTTKYILQTEDTSVAESCHCIVF